MFCVEWTALLPKGTQSQPWHSCDCLPLVVRGTKNSPQWDLVYLTSATLSINIISIQTVPEELKKKGVGIIMWAFRSYQHLQQSWCKIWSCLCPIKGYKYIVSPQSQLLYHAAFLLLPIPSLTILLALPCILPCFKSKPFCSHPVSWNLSLFVYTSFSIDEISIHLVYTGQEQQQ